MRIRKLVIEDATQALRPVGFLKVCNAWVMQALGVERRFLAPIWSACCSRWASAVIDCGWCCGNALPVTPTQ